MTAQTKAEGNRKAHLDARGKRGIAKARRMRSGEEAARLRLQGYTWREIKEELGYQSDSAAWKAWRAWEARQNQDTIEEIRSVQRQRIEKIIKALTPKMESGSTRHAEVTLKALEREAQLLGLDHNAGTQIGPKQGITIIINPDPRDSRAVKLVEGEDRVLLPPIEGALLEEKNSSPDRR